METHPFKPFLPEGARLLMLGTFPPAPKRWCMEFYYPNFTNDMWRIFGICFFGDKEHFIAKGQKRFDLDMIVPFLTSHGIAMYDTAVNMGVSRAVRLAQKALGVREDGIWGPVTRSALRVCDDRKCAAAMCHLRRAKYCELARAHPELSVFLRGWLRRVEALEEEVETA